MKTLLFVTILLVFVPLCIASSLQEAAILPDVRNLTMLNVFVIPHSHDDVGWIISMDDYFFYEVQYIYDTVLQELDKNPDRRFTAIEVGYIKLWYQGATEEQRSLMHRLYEDGQLEFQIGGIVMNDEAAASYIAIINQLQEGHQFLKETFGAVPTIGWQIDPFGSSQGTPTLFAWDCFDALVIDRIPYVWKGERELTQTLEFVWHGTNNLGQETDMFTHCMDSFRYCTPEPFAFGDDWDIYSPPNPNPPITEFNIQQQAQKFADQARLRSLFFATNNLMFPFGCDFQFQNADVMYKNMDKIIDYLNLHQDEYKLNVKYAVLSDYFKELHSLNHTWPTYSGDFFPYNDDSISFWSGYFTSRNTLKGDTREADSVLRSTDVLMTLVHAEGIEYDQSSAWEYQDHLRMQSAVTQHHDSVSGTSRPQVVKDYEWRLQAGMNSSFYVAEEMVQLLLNGAPLSLKDENAMSQLNSNGQSVVLVVQNDLAWNRTEYVSVSVPISDLVVLDDGLSTVPSQIASYGDRHVLWFQASTPALGISTYFIQKSSNSSTMSEKTSISSSSSSSSSSISNGNLILSFDSSSGLLNTIYNAFLGFNVSVEQTLMQYNVSTDSNQPGGAYIFRNDGTAMSLSNYTTESSTFFQTGSLVQSYLHSWDNMTVYISEENQPILVNATQTFTIYYSSTNDPMVNNFIDVEYNIGPLDGNKDLITRWTTSLESNGVFYQDDSGFLTLERTYNPDKTLVIPGNYYPMVSTSFIQDSSARLTIISAQSEGCSSLDNGELEVMLHRRTLQDDYRGLNAPLNDTDRITVRHRVLLDTPTNSENQRHMQRLQLNFPMRLFFGTTSSPQNWIDSYTTSVYPLTAPLPVNVHMLNLQLYDGTSADIILRLQHLFQSDSNSTFAEPVTIDLNTLFTSSFKLQDVKELALSANQDWNSCSAKRYVWQFEESEQDLLQSNDIMESINFHSMPQTQSGDPAIVTLYPSQIKTYSIHLSPAPF